MSDEITPALTPEEWRFITVDSHSIAQERHQRNREDVGEDDCDDLVAEFGLDGVAGSLDEWLFAVRVEQMLDLVGLTPVDGASLNAHAAAAVCLYGQPFGFTQEDVDALLEAIGNDRQSAHAACERAERVAAKIAALLPPAP